MERQRLSKENINNFLIKFYHHFVVLLKMERKICRIITIKNEKNHFFFYFTKNLIFSSFFLKCQLKTLFQTFKNFENLVLILVIEKFIRELESSTLFSIQFFVNEK